MRTLRLVLILALAVAAPAYAQQTMTGSPGAIQSTGPVTVAPAAKPDTPPARAVEKAPGLTDADHVALDAAEKVLADAARDYELERARFERTQVAADRAQIFLQATLLKILALHKLSPDEWEVRQEAVGAAGQQVLAWRIAAKEKPKSPK